MTTRTTRTANKIAEIKRQSFVNETRVALARLKYARAEGDLLKIDLAEAALNDLIDRSQLLQLSRVTNEEPKCP